MHELDGKSYPNENIFQEIAEPQKIVIRHDCNPYFTLTVTIDDIDGGARLNWQQDFDDEAIAKNITHIIGPANEQNLDKLQALVIRS